MRLVDDHLAGSFVFSSGLLLVLALLLCSSSVAAGEGTWYSALYPPDWTPSYADSEGRFLQDFSYAGYHSGLEPLPDEPPGPVLDVTRPPFAADNSGFADATSAIQAAIEAAGEAGGGTVYLPPGTYRLSVPQGCEAALVIKHNRICLAGAGPQETFLLLDDLDMRQKSVILVAGEGTWDDVRAGTVQKITAELTYPTQVIPLDDPTAFAPGDLIVLTHDVTWEWIEEHGMSDLWTPGAIPGATFYRRVMSVDKKAGTITIDAPIRYYLLPRDNARVYKVGAPVSEVGLQGLAIGMRQHPGDGWGSEDYRRQGTAAYDVHASHAIVLRHALNCWVRDIKSYEPKGNWRVHLLSNGILLDRSRHVTIENVDLRHPQYEGGGGNGYLYTLRGNDCLIKNCAAYDGRHNFSFKQAYASGNVITKCYSSSPSGLGSDFHMHLSPSNLIDNVTLDEDRFDARWRGTWGTIPHGLTTTQTVFWNLNGRAYLRRNPHALVVSDQFGYGYVVGTRGSAARVETESNDPVELQDYVEGSGQGASLEPLSLYADQLQRRRLRGGVVHSPELDFRPPVLRLWFANLRSGQEVQGVLDLGLRLQLPKGSSLEHLEIALDGQELYRGRKVPRELTIDTLAYRDGFHTVVAEAITVKGQKVRRELRFAVRNWEKLIDELLPPVKSSWFGTLKRDKTASASDGWVHAEGDGFADESRMVRRADTSEYLIWEMPGFSRYTVVAYVSSQAPSESLTFEGWALHYPRGLVHPASKRPTAANR